MISYIGHVLMSGRSRRVYVCDSEDQAIEFTVQFGGHYYEYLEENLKYIYENKTNH